MRRREVLFALGGAAAWPLSARGEQRIARVGYLSPDPAAANAAFYDAFRSGLRDLGYVEGVNVQIVSRFSDFGGREQLTALASELVAAGVDVIVAGGPAVVAAHNATKTVPIVVSVGGDLVASGFADSLGHPGGNMTGQAYFSDELLVKRLALLKEVKPALGAVGLLVTQGFPSTPRFLRVLAAPAKALGVELRLLEVDGPSDCERALAAGSGASVDGLLVTDVPAFTVGPGPTTVAAVVAHHGLPSAAGLYFARNGGLLAYGVDFVQMHRRAATFVDKILKGAKPGDIPIEQATKFITIVNLKTARALGLDIPPTLLAAADEVIE